MALGWIKAALIIFFAIPIIVLTIGGALMACSLQGYSERLKEEHNG